MKKFDVLRGKTRKFLARNKNSSPFLSSDAFRAICMHQFVSEKALLLAISKENRLGSLLSVFVKIDDSESFYRVALNHGLEFESVLYGDSDLDLTFSSVPISQIKNRIMIQNLNFSHDRFEPLPIGIENLSRFYNGRPELFGDKYFKREKVHKVLVGPFGSTHPDREILNSFLSDNYITVSQFRMSPDDYANFSSSFQFIACPRGNGLDTHRFWECLYRGSIPIVLDSFWAQSLINIGLPILTVRNWSKDEIFKSVETSNFSDFNPSSLEPLWIDYWKEKLM